MKKLEHTLDKIGDYLDKLIYILGGCGLIVAISIYAYNICSWWLSRTRIATADDIALMGLVWASYVGMGLLFRNHGHCTMDFIVEMCPAGLRPLLNIFTDVIILVVSAVAVRYSWILSIKSMKKLLTISKIPYFYCDIAFTIGYAHLFLVVLVDSFRNIVKLFRRERKGEEN